MTDKHLKKLISKSEFIIREAKSQFKHLGLLFSGGKDSVTVLHLAMNCLPKEEFLEIPIIFLDTSFQFQETYDYLNRIEDELGIKITDWKIASRFVPTKDTIIGDADIADRFKCCNARKTVNLRQCLRSLKIDAVMVGIRRDEQAIRNKERFYSPRKTDGSWDYWNQPTEMQGWDIYNTFLDRGEHMRVHPLLEWEEVNIWEYIREFNIPINPLYFAKDGKRMRSIGCKPCTSFIESNASTIDEIIEEIKQLKGTEREGREQDKEADMMRMRALGYM